MLRHLVSRGVFAEPRPGVFAINDTAAFLRSEHPAAMRRWLDLDAFGGQMDLAFTGLLHTVRTGRPAWDVVFGAPFWSYLDANPAMSASFDVTMAAGTQHAVDAASGYDWARARRIVDVGGGSGAFVAEILRAHPTLRATLVDLPDTVERGRRYLAEQGVDERCDFAGQSFFDPLPTGGDVYVLSGVLHDWDDEHATAIMRRCAEALDQGGRVVVVEAHGTSGDDAAMFAEMNLRMLVLCGGRERTVEDFAGLAAGAGLTIATVVTSGEHAIIECRIAGAE
jgi:predicted O-methyltransferase YrrM